MTGQDSLDTDAVKENPNWLHHLPEENNLNTMQFLKANGRKKNKDKFVSFNRTRIKWDLPYRDEIER